MLKVTNNYNAINETIIEAKKMFEDEVLFLDKNMKGADLLEKAQQVIIFNTMDSHDLDSPYTSTTQNQRYLDYTLPTNVENASIILGAGDTLFELLRRDVKRITAIEINDLQIAMYELRKAAILTLSPSQFESFFLDAKNKDFFSKDMYKIIKDGLVDEKYINFWDNFLKLNSREDIRDFYIKGGAEQTSIDKMRYALPYVKKKGLYYKVRENLEKAQIKIINEDAISYLLSTDEKYDYIDITNILLLAYQIECKKNPELFKKLIIKLKEIKDKKLNPGGTFVLDYMFGYSMQELGKNHNDKGDIGLCKDIYNDIYKYLQEEFNIELKSTEAITNAVGLTASTDTILLSKKI